MKIAILGGGYTGLTAAYYLAKKANEITLFEKENELGGLARGFKQPNWNWYLERTYHHLLSSEDDFLSFARDLEFKNIFFEIPQTASLYEVKSVLEQNNFRIIPLDSPRNLLEFPLLQLPDKIRSGLVMAFLKTSPFLSFYEKQSSHEFLEKYMGKNAWKILWQELFRKKFGKYAENILASFIWARIKKRSKKLGYIEGGFQTFTNFVEKKLDSMNVKINKGKTINFMQKKGRGFMIENQIYDSVISTLPTPVTIKIGQNLLPQKYLEKLKKLEYLHAVVLILESKRPILEKTYWLNVCTNKLPLMIVCQHTNFIDQNNYGKNHICYVGWYVDNDNPLLKMDSKEVLKYSLPYVKKLTKNELQITNSYLFKGPFAQPIFDKNFLVNKPEFITPINNFFIANLDMTYPYDRGTNYAVKLGREISELI